ncbi:MAG: hypothetical protein OQK73_13360 [Gammaproteobacteria bacterium]|nr:hypothetical protein [Gammaproteobacteria bacterium]
MKVKNLNKLLQTFLCIFISTSISSIYSVAMAGGFADSFRDYILAEETKTASAEIILAKADRSQKCMQCHDGSNAKAVALKGANAPLQYGRHGNANHPVGLQYASSAYEQPASYVAPSKLDTRIKLENGSVTCVSCHETKTGREEFLHTQEKHSSSQSVSSNQNEACSSTGLLTVGKSQTGLCMSCHVM